MNDWSPARADCAATEFARFPVDAHAVVSNPNSLALDSVVLDVQLFYAQLPREAVGLQQRRAARVQTVGGWPVEWKKVGVSPVALWASLDLVARDVLGDGVVVVGDLEGAEAHLADV